MILLSLLFSLSLFAKKPDIGETLFNNKQYAKAKTVYEDFLKKKPTDALANYRYARCCYELKKAEDAIIHFEMSGTKFPLRDFYLGELYFNSYRFDQSVMAYQTYLTTIDSTDIKRPDLLNKLKKSENAARLITKVEDIAIVDSAVVNKTDFLKYYKFNSELGSLTQAKLNMPHKKKADKITYTTQRQDRVYFSDSIHGQMDLFTSFKLLDGWTKPASISNVLNTLANENYPFVLLDGVTVYYASDGENSIGGYDIFITRYNPTIDSYLTPENIGFPFNSPANDYMMVIDEQRKLGWFATDRRQPTDKVMIYTFVTNESKTILHSDDLNDIRSAASLITYRKVEIKKQNNDTIATNHIKGLEKQIEFIINDSTVYTRFNQFKSKDAQNGWTELNKLTLDYNLKQNELNQLRLKYDKTLNEPEHTNISQQILELERNLVEMKKQIALKTVWVRNEEFKYLLKFEKK